MILALLAAVAMVFNDIFGTLCVMFEAAERGWLAGAMDAAGWLVSITTMTISITALQGHSLSEKAMVISLVTAANLFGTKAGQMTGSRLLRSKRFRKGHSLEERVIALELAAHK